LSGEKVAEGAEARVGLEHSGLHIAADKWRSFPSYHIDIYGDLQHI